MFRTLADRAADPRCVGGTASLSAIRSRATCISPRRCTTRHQGLYFEALARLDAELAQHNGLDEPQLDSLYPFIPSAEFSVGDFELNYRMHLRAGHAITAVLEGNVDEPMRNDAAYRLARIQFQKGQLADALYSLDRIHGRVPDKIRDDVEFLRANVYVSMGRANDAAPILERLEGEKALRGFSDYNLAIAYLLADHRDAALEQFDKAGEVDAADEETMAIRDKSNLVRGTLLMQSGQFVEAKGSLERVRLTGPFSNEALLSSGWADVSAKRYESALVPWNILVQREHTDSAVQEAMLALPYAYSQLAVYGRAAVLYSQALQSYGAGTRQVARVDRQHSRGQIPEGAGARGNSPGQGLGDPSAVVAGIA